MTTKLKRRIALAACVALGAAYAVHRFTSCVWGARDVSGLALHGHFRVRSCTAWYATDTHIVLQMDSATTASVGREAQHDARYRRIEDLRDSLGTGVNGLVEKHGWFASTFGQNSNNGFSTTVIDLTAGTVTVTSYPM